MRQHARLSPSDAARWLSCPAAIRFDDRYPEHEDDFDLDAALAAWAHGDLDVRSLSAANNGTIAHAYAEQIIVQGKAGSALTTLAAATGLAENAHEYADAIVAFLDSGITAHIPTWETERRVPLWYEPGSYGTIDFMAVAGPELLIVDYKSGNLAVDVAESAQLAIYGIALEKEQSLFERVERVRVGICQPAIDPEIQWHTYERGELDGLEKLVSGTAAMLALPDFEPYPRLTPAGCQWCRHKARCPAQEAAARAALDAPSIELLTTEQVAELVRLAPAVKKFLDAAEEYVRENLDLFPMYELGPAKVVRHDWKDAGSAALVLETLGVEPWRPRELISYSAAKKAAGKKNIALLDALTEPVYSERRPLVEASPASETMTDSEAHDALTK